MFKYMHPFQRLLLLLVVLMAVLFSPVFVHKYSDGYVSKYTLVDSLRMDLAEGQFQTPYAITHDLFGGGGH